MSLERFDELYERIDLGTATPADRVELSERLAADMTCRRRLVELSLRDAHLRKLFGASVAAPVVAVAPPATDGSVTQANWRRWRLLSWVAAAVLCLAAGLLVWQPGGWTSKGTAAPVSDLLSSDPVVPSSMAAIHPLFEQISGRVTVNGADAGPLVAGAVIQTTAEASAELRGHGVRLLLAPSTTVIARRMADSSAGTGRIAEAVDFDADAGAVMKLELLAGQVEIQLAAGADWQLSSPFGDAHPVAEVPSESAWRMALGGKLSAEVAPGSADDRRSLIVTVLIGQIELTPPAIQAQAGAALRVPLRLSAGQQRTFRANKRRHHDANHPLDADDEDDDDDDDRGEPQQPYPGADPDSRPRAEEEF